MKRKRALAQTLVLATLLNSSIAWADGAKQFDLVCSGQLEKFTCSFPSEEGPWTCVSLFERGPFTVRVHVDLGQKNFCLDECELVFPVTAQSDGSLSYRYRLSEEKRFRDDYENQGAMYVPQSDDMKVSEKSFWRDFRYEAGTDMFTNAYANRYSGSCNVRPFTDYEALHHPQSG